MQHEDSTARGRRVCLLERESSVGDAPAAIATQHQLLTDATTARQDTIIDVCVDAGFSGALPPLERPAIVRMLALADAGAIDYVLATDLSRVNRGDAFNYYFIRHELERAGVTLELLDEMYHDDGESEAGALIEGIHVLLPSIERRNTRRRLAGGKARMVREGFSWTGRRPFGLDYTPGGQRHGRWSKRDDEVPHVQRLFALAAEGHSRDQIARLFNAEGVPSVRGGKWWGSTIGGILANPRYKGVFPLGRHELVRATRTYRARPARPSTGQSGTGRQQLRTGHRLRPAGEWASTVEHPECQIVSPELWARANAMAGANRAARAARTKAPRLLHGLIYCEGAHDLLPRSPMHAKEAATRAPRYGCSWRAHPGAPACGRSVAALPLEGAVWALVRELALDPTALLGDFIGACEDLTQQRRRVRAHQEEARAQVAKYEGALDSLTLALHTGDLAPDEYTRVRALAEGQLAVARSALERALATAAEEEEGPLAALADALLERVDRKGPGSDTAAVLRRAVRATLGDVSAAELDALDAEGRRRKVRQVVERVEVGAAGVQVRLRLGARAVPLTNRTSPYSVGNEGVALVLPLRVG